MKDAQLAIVAALRARIADQLNLITEEVMDIFEEKIANIIEDIEEDIIEDNIDGLEIEEPVSQEVSDLLAEQRRIERQLNGQ